VRICPPPGCNGNGAACDHAGDKVFWPETSAWQTHTECARDIAAGRDHDASLPAPIKGLSSAKGSRFLDGGIKRVAIQGARPGVESGWAGSGRPQLDTAHRFRIGKTVAAEGGPGFKTSTSGHNHGPRERRSNLVHVFYDARRPARLKPYFSKEAASRGTAVRHRQARPADSHRGREC